MEPTRVAACQLAVDDLDVAGNLETVVDRVAALPADVELAVFPEYALTGFVADERIREAAIQRDGPELARVAEAAAESECSILVGFVERAPEEDSTDGEGTQTLYNAAAYVTEEGDVSIYRKRHRWGGERDWIARGEDRLVVDTPAGRAGVLTCYDLNFVEDSTALARESVDLLLVPGSWPAAYSENWRLLCRARALDGVRWVVAAGRTGMRELPDAHPTEYAGRSLIVRPDGSVMAALNRAEDDLTATLDPAELRRTREFIPVLDTD